MACVVCNADSASFAVTIPEALTLALRHHQGGRLTEAQAIYAKIVAADPTHAQALHLMGVIAHQTGRNALAVDLIHRAIASSPHDAAFHSNLGAALIELRRFDDAITALRHANELRAGYAEALYNLGNALCAGGRVEEAVAKYRSALALAPKDPEMHNNLGAALAELGCLEEAIARFHDALRLRPGYVEALGNLGSALKDEGHVDEAIRIYRETLHLQPGRAYTHSDLLLALHFSNGVEAQVIFREHLRWNDLHAKPHATECAPFPNTADPNRRLRIGYVSPDFREHSVALFSENLLACHDREKVAVYCYAELRRPDPSGFRARIGPTMWRETTGLTDAEVAAQVRRDEIDILVDLAGHTGFHRLLAFARRPAPVQVTYLGYCDTTGLDAMDYRLTDAHADPQENHDHLHSEKLIRLPDCAWCFRPPEAAPEVPAPPAATSGTITFGCFNAVPKITAEILGIWARILNAVPASRLLLKASGLRDGPACARILGILASSGVPAERVTLAPYAPTRAAHLALYGSVDIALDTFPYHGTTTTCEALWMGVPVITLAGKTHVSRVGVSLLTNAGLPELIAHTATDYARLATSLANDDACLSELRATLRGKMKASPLMDAPRFARNIEQAYREMWGTWCAKQNRPAAS